VTANSGIRTIIYRSMRKFSNMSESAYTERQYEVTLAVTVRVVAANEGEAVYLASMLSGVDVKSVDVTGVSTVEDFEKNNNE
jgi:hypothetical protein